MPLQGWALELASRNPTFAALDCVLERKGLLVNVLLRLTMPDSLINFTMACSKCPFWAFVVSARPHVCGRAVRWSCACG